MKGVPVRRAAAVASDVERNRRIDEAVAAALSRTQGLKIGKPWPMGEGEAIYPEPKTRIHTSISTITRSYTSS